MAQHVSYYDNFEADVLFSNECDATVNGKYNYWIGKDGNPLSFFDLDMGFVILIKKIILKNAQNQGYRDRSSKDISIYISKCQSGFVEVISDILENANILDCANIPLHEYDINQVGRFVRFHAHSYYGASAGLNYFFIDYDYPSGLSNETYSCPGK